MARMFPAAIYSDTKSSGEIEIFRRLRDDPQTNDWIVFHSLDIANHHSQVFGEIDFVIIVPAKGVLCLEVKAVRSVKRENGMWFLGSNPTPELRGPFKQASEGMHSLRKYVIEKVPSLSNVVFWSAVIFPFIEFNEESTEWHTWQAIDSRYYRSRSVGQIVQGVLNKAREFLCTKPSSKWFKPENIAPDKSQCKDLIDCLRPNFEFFESPEARAGRLDEELKQYTSEQIDALDAMISNPRVIFNGPAGTGKTLLAIETARRSQHKTLFLCFNRLLGNWLKESTKSLEPLVTTNTLHGFMLSIANIQAPNSPTSHFWEEELPNLAIERIIEKESNEYLFDKIIIDEAQDIIRPLYLDFLDLVLKGGLFSGEWQIYGDFEKQSIYEAPTEVLSIINSKFSTIPKYSLRVNCRNTPRIADFVQVFGGLKPGYTRVRRPDNQINPEIRTYRSDKEQGEILLQIIKNLMHENYRCNEIVVLSNRSDENCAVSKLETDNIEMFCNLRSSKLKEKVRYGTIHSFKGLEAPVIILTDIDSVGTENSKSVFYIGVTRAISKLIVLVSKTAQKEMLEIWGTI